MSSKEISSGPLSHTDPATFHDRIFAYIELTRLHKWPLGNNVVFWPCAYGLLMASISAPAQNPLRSLLFETLLYAIGATLMHSKSCILSDICDREFDGKVERTKNRPLVSGRVSLNGAWSLLLVLLSTGLSLLTYVNRKAAMYGLFGVFALHATYPLMKRYTWWPQFFLGLAINWGLFVGWLSVCSNARMLPIYVMYAGLVCWTIYYDTIYACQDRTDDVKAGVKSTALLFGGHVKLILRMFAFAFLALIALSGFLNDNGPWFYIVSCGCTALHLFWQQYSWDDTDIADCMAKFKSNGDMGAIIWVGLLMDYLSRNDTLLYASSL